jgi:hypothetical protein
MGIHHIAGRQASAGFFVSYSFICTWGLVGGLVDCVFTSSPLFLGLSQLVSLLALLAGREL